MSLVIEFGELRCTKRQNDFDKKAGISKSCWKNVTQMLLFGQKGTHLR